MPPRAKSPAKPKAPELVRIQVRLRGGPAAKLFTSQGPKRQGSVIELPEEEAARFLGDGRAVVSTAELHDVPLAHLEGSF